MTSLSFMAASVSTAVPLTPSMASLMRYRRLTSVTTSISLLCSFARRDFEGPAEEDEEDEEEKDGVSSDSISTGLAAVLRGDLEARLPGVERTEPPHTEGEKTPWMNRSPSSACSAESGSTMTLMTSPGWASGGVCTS